MKPLVLFPLLIAVAGASPRGWSVTSLLLQKDAR